MGTEDETEFVSVEEDVQLARRCRDGDESALLHFVERFQGIVFGLCYRMLGHRQDAEDTAQEVFVRALRSLHTWDGERPLKPWLLAIAANRCRTALGKRAKRPTPTEFVVPPAVEESRGNRDDLAEELQLALDELREDYRLCFELFHFQDCGCEEIGQMLGCPPGTVKTWLHRARRELARFLERRGVVPHARFQLEAVRASSS